MAIFDQRDRLERDRHSKRSAGPRAQRRNAGSLPSKRGLERSARQPDGHNDSKKAQEPHRDPERTQRLGPFAGQQRQQPQCRIRRGMEDMGHDQTAVARQPKPRVNNRDREDLRREDLLDDARSGSLLLVDSQRHQAVAAARLLRRSNSDGLEVELSLHPAWSQLMGPPLAELLRQSCQAHWPIS